MAENFWSRWVQAPQNVLLRKAIFQVHLWTAIGLGIYIFVISLSGSVLVYRNELYIHFGPQPVLVERVGTSMSQDALERAARQAYPGHEVRNVRPGTRPRTMRSRSLSAGTATRYGGCSIRSRARTSATPCRWATASPPGSSICTTTCWAARPGVG